MCPQSYSPSRYKAYKEQQEEAHKAWEERQKIRAEKLAKGETVGPEEPDPTAPQEIGLLAILKFFLIVGVVAALAGKFFTDSYTWEYQSRWTQLKTYLPAVRFQHLLVGPLS